MKTVLLNESLTYLGLYIASSIRKQIVKIYIKELVT